jgi:hypothetical protein
VRGAGYYAVVPVTRETRDAASKPLENAAALVYRDGGKLMSFRPKSGWTRSGSADADAVAGLGDDTAVKVTPSEAAMILQRLDPAASLLTT